MLLYKVKLRKKCELTFIGDILAIIRFQLFKAFHFQLTKKRRKHQLNKLNTLNAYKKMEKNMKKLSNKFSTTKQFEKHK